MESLFVQCQEILRAIPYEIDEANAPNQFVIPWKDDIIVTVWPEPKYPAIHFTATKTDISQCPAIHMDAMMELVCRMNWGLCCGRWDLDASDGQLDFEYCWLLNHSDAIERNRFLQIIDICTLMITQYEPAIRQIMRGNNITPEEACTIVEMADFSSP